MYVDPQPADSALCAHAPARTRSMLTALTCAPLPGRRDEVVVARQLKHAAYRTARVERRHRRLLSHTQAPPVALEQTEAGRGIAVGPHDATIVGIGAVGGGSGVPSARGRIFRPCASRAMPLGNADAYASSGTCSACSRALAPLETEVASIAPEQAVRAM